MSPEALEIVAERFRVLAEPMRLQILQLLRSGEKNVSELTSVLETTQPNVSKHLRTLHEAGLIGRRYAGNNVFCHVTDTTVFELCDSVSDALYKRMTEKAKVLARRR